MQRGIRSARASASLKLPDSHITLASTQEHPKRARLGLIEAELTLQSFSTIGRGIRSARASASLKPGLGLGVGVGMLGIRSARASASLKHRPGLG